MGSFSVAESLQSRLLGSISAQDQLPTHKVRRVLSRIIRCAPHASPRVRSGPEENPLSLSIHSGVSALIAARYLNGAQVQLSRSTERLATGYRINRAADDAAGLAIAVGLRSQIGGMTVALRNTQDGVSVTRTADGALGQTTAALQQMRDLAVRAANAGSPAQRNALNNEFVQLRAELDQIASRTSYGSQKLLDGTYSGAFQVGANVGDEIVLDLSASKVSSLGAVSGGDGSQITGLTANGLNVGSADLSLGIRTQTSASAAIAAVDKALAGVSTVRSHVGATENRFERTISSLDNSIANLTDAHSRIMDTDMAVETLALSRAQIQSEVAAAMLAQANANRSIVLRLLLQS